MIIPTALMEEPVNDVLGLKAVRVVSLERSPVGCWSGVQLQTDPCVSDSHQIARWRLWSGWSASPQSEPTSAGYWMIRSGGPGGPEDIQVNRCQAEEVQESCRTFAEQDLSPSCFDTKTAQNCFDMN